MRSSYAIFLLALLGSCFGKQPVLKTGLEGKPLPEFTILLQDSTSFKSTSIPGEKPFILFYFSPGCPYCRAQMREFAKTKAKTKSISIYALATESMNEVKAFYKEFALDKVPNIKVGVDNTYFLDNYFHPDGVPYMAVYGKNRELKRVFSGKTDLNLVSDVVFK